jgi:hypothetical protein
VRREPVHPQGLCVAVRQLRSVLQPPPDAPTQRFFAAVFVPRLPKFPAADPRLSDAAGPPGVGTPAGGRSPGIVPGSPGEAAVVAATVAASVPAPFSAVSDSLGSAVPRV